MKSQNVFKKAISRRYDMTPLQLQFCSFITGGSHVSTRSFPAFRDPFFLAVPGVLEVSLPLGGVESAAGLNAVIHSRVALQASGDAEKCRN